MFWQIVTTIFISIFKNSSDHFQVVIYIFDAFWSDFILSPVLFAGQ